MARHRRALTVARRRWAGGFSPAVWPKRLPPGTPSDFPGASLVLTVPAAVLSWRGAGLTRERPHDHPKATVLDVKRGAMGDGLGGSR